MSMIGTRNNPLETIPALRKSLLFSFIEGMRIITERFEDIDATEYGITIREALLLIGTMDCPVRQGDLADCLNIQRSVMVGVLDACEEKGILERCPSPDKRGEWMIRPTKKGGKIAKSLTDERHKVAEKIFAPLRAEQVDGGIKLLQLIIDHHYKKGGD